ncbi:MAG: hypothetical protein PHO30_03080 [Candidatus Omnitrophica bacterium]|nr:hypothetical protein [Candidatus Omnitrophota bacterium]
MAKVKKIKCPACGEMFELEEGIKIGDTICCLDCDHELQVVRLEPPKVKKLVDYPEVYSDDHAKQRFHNVFGEEEEENGHESEYGDGYREDADEEEEPDIAEIDEEVDEDLSDKEEF